MIICNNIIGLSPHTPQKARIRGSEIFLCGRKFTTYFWNSQANLVRELRFYGLFRITFEKIYKIMAQKCDCGSRNATKRERDTKKTIPKPPGSLNDNPIMCSIPRAALQPSERQLHEDKDHPYIKKNRFKIKKVPELHSQGTCSFLQKTM